ncbi:multidrug and toxin extrusion family efflux pump protein [Desulfocucumis palustris]|uniref:Multidrug and toxin extrusion family efflux pump protein n=1 Tax=Desulfocucumis palustris TaxID=1898651 RepID=A0A2L2XAA7_9FIRM|nr:MFS transporter [Desulfocucumis palustris]GBF32982.1 multidrug and toxin extrusion family efflux pump protein [Desulfocucumis palustris]
MPGKANTATVAALSGVPFIMVLGNSMIIPVLPAIKSAFGLTDFKLSLIISLFSIPAGLIIPLAGFLSDRYGRKIVILPSLVLYGLGGVMAGLAAIFFKEAAFPVILGGRVLQGIGAAGTAPIAMALCGDLFQGKERSKTLGIIEAANGFGKVISPILGAAIGLIVWYAVFLFFPLVVIPITLGLWFLVKEPKSNRTTQKVNEYLNSVKKIFEKKSAMLLTSFLAGMVALLVLFGVLFFLSEFLEKTYNLKGVIKGFALAVPVLFMSATSFATGLLIKKKVKLMKWLVVAGLSVIAGSMALLGIFQNNTILFFVGISLAGVGTGLTLPCLNTIITSSCAAERRGIVTSLYGSVRFFGVAFGPPAFGILLGQGRPFMFWSAAGLAAVAAISSLLLIRVKDMEKTSDNKAEADQGRAEKKQRNGPPEPALGLFPLKKPLPDGDNKS